MRRFEKVLAGSDETSLPTLTLPYDLRRKTRQLVRLNDGEEIGLLLAPGSILKDGDVLESAEGVGFASWQQPNRFLFVTASDREKLTRAAYSSRQSSYSGRNRKCFSASRGRSSLEGDVTATRAQCRGKERSLQSRERGL